MPIYAYRCSACGYQNDYLQKVSDPLLSECPECGKSTFQKQVTAAGFQLKGSGWYATDFKNNGNGKSKSASKDESRSGKEESKSGSESPSDGESKPSSSAGAGATPAS